MPALTNAPASYRTGRPLQPLANGQGTFAPGTPGTSPLVTAPKGVSQRPAGMTQRPNGSWRPAATNGSTSRPMSTRGGTANAPMEQAVAQPTAAVPATQPPVATPPPAPSGLANPYQVTPAGQAGLGNMGIPLPPAYTPRAPMTPIPASPAATAGTTTGTTTNNGPTLTDQFGPASPYFGNFHNYNDFAGDVTNRVSNYTGGVLHSSNPVTPGSAVNGGIGGPGAAAALGAWQNAQANAQLRQAFGDRGPQMALRDVQNGPSYVGGSLAAQNAASGGQARDAQGRAVWRDAGGNITYTPPAGAAAPQPMQAAQPPATGGAVANPTPAPAGDKGSASLPSGSTSTGMSTPSTATPSVGSATGSATALAAAAGNNNALLNQVAQTYDANDIAATNANEQRYRDILSGYGSAFDRQNNLLTDAGKVQADALNRQFDSLQSKNLQDAVSRGLGGTTILPSMRRGTENSRAQAQNELADQIRQQRLAVDQKNSSDALQFMERRDDNQPNMSDLVNLAQALGNSGDGQPAATVQPLQNYGGGYLGGGGGFQGIDYVSNGLDGGAYGQQAGTYNSPQMVNNGAAQQAQYLQLMQAMLGGGQQQPLTYMQRQRQAIVNGNQQNAVNRVLGDGSFTMRGPTTTINRGNTFGGLNLSEADAQYLANYFG